MASLTALETECLTRYVSLLERVLAEQLVEVRMFGSAARGDMWPASSPMHSDIDLLVVTREEVVERDREALVNETYPLFLECGRQLSPHFYTGRELARPERERFAADIAGDAIILWPAAPR